MRTELGRGHYQAIGKKGGDAVKAARGLGFYQAIGKKGGEKMRATHGPEFFSEIGKKGGQRMAALVVAGKKALKDASAKDIVGLGPNSDNDDYELPPKSKRA